MKKKNIKHIQQLLESCCRSYSWVLSKLEWESETEKGKWAVVTLQELVLVG